MGLASLGRPELTLVTLGIMVGGDGAKNKNEIPMVMYSVGILVLVGDDKLCNNATTNAKWRMPWTGHLHTSGGKEEGNVGGTMHQKYVRNLVWEV